MEDAKLKIFGYTANSAQPCLINYTELHSKNGLGLEEFPEIICKIYYPW